MITFSSPTAEANHYAAVAATRIANDVRARAYAATLPAIPDVDLDEFFAEFDA